MYFVGEWAYVSGHTIVKGEGESDTVPAPQQLSAEHTQYYKMLFTIIGGPSNDLFKVGVCLSYGILWLLCYICLYSRCMFFDIPT